MASLLNELPARRAVEDSELSHDLDLELRFAKVKVGAG